MPQRKGTPTPAQAERIRAAVAWKKAAETELAAAVIDAMRNGASLRETAPVAELSDRTLSRWRQGKGLPTAEELRESRRREDRKRAREFWNAHAHEYGLPLQPDPDQD